MLDLKHVLQFLQDDIWITILSLYANSTEIPLPHVDEVLVCNQNTSAEEVSIKYLFKYPYSSTEIIYILPQIEIMCLRAKANKSGKLHCLARVELLDYNVAVSVEKSLLSLEGPKFLIIEDSGCCSSCCIVQLVQRVAFVKAMVKAAVAIVFAIQFALPLASLFLIYNA